MSPSVDLPICRLLRPTWRRVFKALLPPIWSCVEEGIGVRETFSATRVDRVGMENIVVEAEEDAEAVLLSLHSVGALPCLHLGKGSIVVFYGRDTLVERDVKIIIEIAAKRRIPRDVPSLLRLVG